MITELIEPELGVVPLISRVEAGDSCFQPTGQIILFLIIKWHASANPSPFAVKACSSRGLTHWSCCEGKALPRIQLSVNKRTRLTILMMVLWERLRCSRISPFSLCDLLAAECFESGASPMMSFCTSFRVYRLVSSSRLSVPGIHLRLCTSCCRRARLCRCNDIKGPPVIEFAYLFLWDGVVVDVYSSLCVGSHANRGILF